MTTVFQQCPTCFRDLNYCDCPKPSPPLPYYPTQQGCVCPPTSEQTCQNGLCPRKPLAPVS